MGSKMAAVFWMTLFPGACRGRMKLEKKLLRGFTSDTKWQIVPTFL